MYPSRYKCPKCRLPYCSVKCCKEHKLKCPAVVTKDKSKKGEGNDNSKTKTSPNSNTSTFKNTSKYLSAEQLNRDPLGNSIKRRKMLEEDEDSDYDESDDQEGWRITRDMMDRLDNSSWLRKELEDGGLRQIIAEIDYADAKDQEEQNASGASSSKKRKKPGMNKMGKPVELTPREVALLKAKLTNPTFQKFMDKLLVTAGVLIEDVKTDEEIASLLLSGQNPDNCIGRVTLVNVVKNRREMLKNDEPGQTDSSISDDDEDSETSDGDSSS